MSNQTAQREPRTTKVREFGIPIPERIAKLAVDHRGYPVPWFVAWFDGTPDFRVIDTPKLAIAHNQSRCWICGERLGAWLAFVVGPMCAVNRVSSEPPSHRECAEFAARTCPFLTMPKAQRREAGTPAETQPSAGVGLKRNPGVALVWVTKDYGVMRVASGVLFRIGAPRETIWICEGRTATRAEVMASIDSGLPLLREPAEAEGPGAVRALERMTADALRLLPKETAHV
ncbi:MAG TPA: hypothetical protein VGI97_14880 [Gemmatimonadaceae bacterium]|jgi:hypothetical protein